MWGDAYGVELPHGLSIENWSYTLQTAWGTEMLLDYDPLGPIKDVTWDAASSVTSRRPDSEYFLDINESACCVNITDHDSVVRGLADADWVAAGRGSGGRTVYIAAMRNPLLATMYRLYAEHRAYDSATAADGGPLRSGPVAPRARAHCLQDAADRQLGGLPQLPPGCPNPGGLNQLATRCRRTAT